MATEINVFSDRAKALVKKEAHEALKRQTTLETAKGLAIYDHRGDGEPENLLLSPHELFVVTATWK